VRGRLGWAFALVIMVTGLCTALALALVIGLSVAKQPPLSSIAPSAQWLHTLEPGPGGGDPGQDDPAIADLRTYTTRLFSAQDFDRLWIQTAWRRLAGFAGLAAVGVIIVAVSSGYVLARGVADPLGKFADTVEDLSATNLHRRVELPNADEEFGRLAESFNAMLDRLEDSFADMEAATSYVSHELRTSLTVIRTHLEVGLSGARDLEPAARKALAATDKAATMVESALALASRSVPGASGPVDLAMVVAEAVDDYSLPGRTINFDLPAEGVPPIHGNATWLHRAVANLLDNAFRHGPAEGPVTVRVSTRHDAVVVEVEDHGPGIPGDELERIWQRFYRGDRSRAEPGQGEPPGAGPTEGGKPGRRGYGLGLALVRQAVESAGGAVWVTSTPGSGTTFHLSIPQADSWAQ
jgi:two-component system OmpR family sensor kinase